VAAFVIGMLLTPPDIISQTMLAVPMLLLFEVGLAVAAMHQKKKQNTHSREIG
jgi:sec-independent protein translocase protein TatC